LWIVKFYEGGISYDSIMEMDFLELKMLMEKSTKIAGKLNG
jgi:hypothetical protein